MSATVILTNLCLLMAVQLSACQWNREYETLEVGKAIMTSNRAGYGLSYDSAKQFCEESKMTLLEVDSETEMDIMNKFTVTGDSFWLGAQSFNGTKPPSHWSVSGRPIGWSNWATNQPTSDNMTCSAIVVTRQGDSNWWQRMNCAGSRYYPSVSRIICQRHLSTPEKLRHRVRSMVNQVASQNSEIVEIRSSVAKLEAEVKSEKSVNRDLDSLNSQIKAKADELAKCKSEMEKLLEISGSN